MVGSGNTPWFIAKEIAELLGYPEAKNALLLCKKSDSAPNAELNKINNLPPATKWIPESDLFRLVMRSNKPDAVDFQDLVCEEILPSIRKTGSYTAKPKADSPIKQSIEANRIFKSNLSVAKLIFKGNQATLSANQATLKATGIDVLSNLDAVHLLAETKDVLLTPSDIGKQLGVSPVKVNAILEAKGFQQSYRDARDKKHWKLTAKGERYAELLDTGKRQGNGTPVVQIKWREPVLPFLQ